MYTYRNAQSILTYQRGEMLKFHLEFEIGALFLQPLSNLTLKHSISKFDNTYAIFQTIPLSLDTYIFQFFPIIMNETIKHLYALILWEEHPLNGIVDI